MLKLIFTRGLPGSGKSTYIKSINQPKLVLSTDDYWVRPDGLYDFNISNLGRAHRWNQERFLEGLSKFDLIIIDNTNLTYKEIEFYVTNLKQLESDASIDLVFFPCEPAQSIIRNVHNVPISTINKMYERIESNDFIKSKINEVVSCTVNCFEINTFGE